MDNFQKGIIKVELTPELNELFQKLPLKVELTLELNVQLFFKKDR